MTESHGSDSTWPVPGSELLISSLRSALPTYVRAVVTARVGCGLSVDSEERLNEVGERIGADVEARMSDVLGKPVEEQQMGPLQIVRDGLAPVTQFLAGMGVAAPERDEFSRRVFPADIYGIAPASFREINEELHDVGIAWGAAKAWLHLQHRKPTERRPAQ